MDSAVRSCTSRPPLYMLFLIQVGLLILLLVAYAPKPLLNVHSDVSTWTKSLGRDHIYIDNLCIHAGKASKL